MGETEWTDLIPIAQSVLNNSLAPQRGSVCPIIAFMSREPTLPIKTFLRTETSKTVTLSEAQAKSAKMFKRNSGFETSSILSCSPTWRNIDAPFALQRFVASYPISRKVITCLWPDLTFIQARNYAFVGAALAESSKLSDFVY